MLLAPTWQTSRVRSGASSCTLQRFGRSHLRLPSPWQGAQGQEDVPGHLSLDRCAPSVGKQKRILASATGSAAGSISISPALQGDAAPQPGKQAVVVGAGPSGCLMAMYLARAGWHVDVFERRPEPGPLAATSRQRSWVIALYRRGIKAVEAVADVPLLTQRRYKGLVLGRKDGKPPVVLQRPGALVDRTTLANAILDAARSQYSHAITFHFGAPLTSLDPHARTATFGNGATLSYDLLVGADGTNSAVRQSLMEAIPACFTDEVLTVPGSQYKTFYGLPALDKVLAWDPDASVPQEKRGSGQFFFTVPGDLPGANMAVCRDTDGQYCGYLIMPEGAWDDLRTPQDHEDIVRKAGLTLPEEWLALIADKLAAAPPSNLPTMRRLSRFSVPDAHVVLLGDAAHAVTPALGQGANSALQDCRLLDDAMKRHPGNLAAALSEFSEQRQPQIRSLQELELLMAALLSPFTFDAMLLLRKWIIFHYFGISFLATVLANLSKGQEDGASKADSGAGVPNFVQAPPLYELLEGDVGYTDMLDKVRFTALLGSATTALLLAGMLKGISAVATGLLTSV